MWRFLAHRSDKLFKQNICSRIITFRPLISHGIFPKFYRTSLFVRFTKYSKVIRREATKTTENAIHFETRAIRAVQMDGHEVNSRKRTNTTGPSNDTTVRLESPQQSKEVCCSSCSHYFSLLSLCTCESRYGMRALVLYVYRMQNPDLALDMIESSVTCVLGYPHVARAWIHMH